jgi:hypothetical protein
LLSGEVGRPEVGRKSEAAKSLKPLSKSPIGPENATEILRSADIMRLIGGKRR